MYHNTLYRAVTENVLPKQFLDREMKCPWPQVVHGERENTNKNGQEEIYKKRDNEKVKTFQ